MRSLRFVAVLFLASMLTLALGCGGGGGGGTSGGGPLAKGTFTKTIAPDVSVGTQSGPFNVYAYRRAMHIYLASDVNGAGYIKAISFRRNADVTTKVDCPNTTVRLGHTSKVQFDGVDNNFASYVEEGKGSLVTMINDAIVSIPAGSAGDYYSLNFTAPFYYNGVDNLVVDVERTTACTGDVGNSMEQNVGYNAQLYSGTVGPTGSASAVYQQIKFTFSGGDTALEYGGSGSNQIPFRNYQEHVQILYLADEVNGSGPITGIGMQVSQLTSQATYTYTVKLGHTTLSALTSTFAANFDSGSPATVASSATFTIPAGVPVDDYVWIPITGSFTYNGTDNLILDIEVPYASGTNSWRTNNVMSGRRLRGGIGNATGTVDSYMYHTKFRFNGGPLAIVTDSALDDTRFFPTSATGIVSLFRATELGTGGKITSVSCRAGADTVSGSYPSFTLVIGHTDADKLTDISDFVSQNTAYTGNYSIPNTLKKGDWITVPLSTPFTYDGKSNLIVWFGSTASGGSGSNSCSFSSIDSGRYLDHTGLGVPGASYSPSSDIKTDISLEIVK